jgi:hypothetical protein
MGRPLFTVPDPNKVRVVVTATIYSHDGPPLDYALEWYAPKRRVERVKVAIIASLDPLTAAINDVVFEKASKKKNGAKRK